MYHMAHNHGTELIKNNNWHKARIGGYSCRSRAIPPYSRCVTPSASGEISRPRGPPKAAPSPPSEERAMNGGGRSADLTADDPAAYHTDLRERRDLSGSDGVQAPHTPFLPSTLLKTSFSPSRGHFPLSFFGGISGSSVCGFKSRVGLRHDPLSERGCDSLRRL